jgi:hypothetical protein
LSFVTCHFQNRFSRVFLLASAASPHQNTSTYLDEASLTPATKVEKVESEPRFRASIGDYSGRLRLLSGASSLAKL